MRDPRAIAVFVAAASMLPPHAVAATASVICPMPAPYMVTDLLMDASGNLIASTEGAAANKSAGTVIKLSPPSTGNGSWTATTLAKATRFAALNLQHDESDNYYIIAEGYAAMSVNRLSPPPVGRTAWPQKVLYTVNNGTGVNAFNAATVAPGGRSIFLSSAFTGAHSCGSDSCGSILELKPPASGKTYWSSATLYDFANGSDGAYPTDSLLLARDGSLWGVNYSTFFRLSPPAASQTQWTLTTLHSFQGGTDGFEPKGLPIRDGNGAFYGVTLEGGGTLCGGDGCGTVYKLRPPATGTDWPAQILYRFQPMTTGGYVNVYPGLTFGPAGSLYGTVTYSTAATTTAFELFKLTPPAPGHTAWSYSTVYRWNDGANQAQSPVVADSNGTLYVAAGPAGSFRYTNVYKIVP